MKQRRTYQRFIHAATASLATMTMRPSKVQAALPAEISGSGQAIEHYLRPVIDLFQGNPWLPGFIAMLVTFTVASFIT